MKLSIHPEICGKWPRGEAFPYTGWTNIEVDSVADAFRLITEEGYVSSCFLDESGLRGAMHFRSRQLFMVDIDSGMTIPELFDNLFYESFACGFYATPSWTPELHKFRILFQKETPIESGADASKLMRALNREFGGDPVCKDPTRIFYGTPDCEIKELRADVFLPDSIVQALINEINEYDESQMQIASTQEYTEMTDEQKSHIVKLLSSLNLRYSGMYDTWRNIGWGLKAGGFRVEDFVYITSQISSSKTASDARAVWKSGDGTITMGSVIYLLRQHYDDEQIFMSKTREELTLARLQEKLYKKYKGNTYGKEVIN